MLFCGKNFKNVLITQNVYDIGVHMHEQITQNSVAHIVNNMRNKLEMSL